MFDDIINHCRFLLNHFPAAQPVKDYIDSRILPEYQEMFQFGYFPPAEHLTALTDMIDEKALQKSNLLYSKDIGDAMGTRQIYFPFFQQHPLILPFRDPYGKIMAIVGRTFLSEKERKEKKIEKYKNTTPFRKGNYLFGLYENKQHILQHNGVYIVEGQFDVIKAAEKGYRNVVAIGSASMSYYQFSVISRYTNNIFLLLDNDEAGRKGRKRAMDKFGHLANIRNFYLPEIYKDVDECLSNGDGSLSLIVDQ
jgi:DNA primase